jgi:hypothetical protein
VLELTKDMVELDAPLFSQTESTIAAGDLADGAVAVQVHKLMFYHITIKYHYD